MEKRLRVRRLLIVLSLLFVAVFLLRWGYEIFFAEHDVVIQYSTNYETGDTKSNIASDRIVQKGKGGQEITVDQKYDKTANLSAETDNFDGTNDALRDIIDRHEAVIQRENLTGLTGSQTLTLSIGVIPDRFDDMVAECKALGELRGFTVTKVDKTNEYRTLMAEIETLEKTRDSYQALKVHGGDIQDLLLLEEKILEVESMLQAVSVDAGLFTNENSFCTVNVTMVEVATRSLSVRSILHYALSSFLWTIAAFAVLFFVVIVAVGFAYAIVSMTGRMRPAQMEAPHSEEPKETSGGTDHES